MGFGRPSEMLQITTAEELPEGSPINIQVVPMSSTKLRIEWDPPDKKYWHGVILGYYLGYRELGSALHASSSGFGGEGGGGRFITYESTTTTATGINAGYSNNRNNDMNGFHFRTVEVSHNTI